MAVTATRLNARSFWWHEAVSGIDSLFRLLPGSRSPTGATPETSHTATSPHATVVLRLQGARE